MPKYRVEFERVTTITERATADVEAKNRQDAIMHASANELEWGEIAKDVNKRVVEAKPAPPAKAAAE